MSGLILPGTSGSNRAQQNGYVDAGCISGAQIDKFGNLNSTGIGTYPKLKVRLAGSGGANDIASSASRTIIMMRQDGRNFVNKLTCSRVTWMVRSRESRTSGRTPCGGYHHGRISL